MATILLRLSMDGHGRRASGRRGALRNHQCTHIEAHLLPTHAFAKAICMDNEIRVQGIALRPMGHRRVDAVSFVDRLIVCSLGVLTWSFVVVYKQWPWPVIWLPMPLVGSSAVRLARTDSPRWWWRCTIPSVFHFSYFSFHFDPLADVIKFYSRPFISKMNGLVRPSGAWADKRNELTCPCGHLNAPIEMPRINIRTNWTNIMHLQIKRIDKKAFDQRKKRGAALGIRGKLFGRRVNVR